MTTKMKKFCIEYFASGNATESAKLAGYSKKTAYSQGQRLLKNVEVQNELKKLAKEYESSKIANAKEMQEVLTSIIRQELSEEVLTVEGCGDGISETVKNKKKPSNKDVISAIDKLARMQGLFDSAANVNLVVPVFEGEDDLDE